MLGSSRPPISRARRALVCVACLILGRVSFRSVLRTKTLFSCPPFGLLSFRSVRWGRCVSFCSVLWAGTSSFVPVLYSFVFVACFVARVSEFF